MFVTSGQEVGPFDSSGYMSLEDSYCKSLVTHAFQILQPRAKKYLQQNSITIPIFPIYFSIFVTCYVFFKEMGTTFTHGATQGGFAGRFGILWMQAEKSCCVSRHWEIPPEASTSAWPRRSVFSRNKKTGHVGKSVDSVGWIFIGRQEIHDMEVTQKKDERRFQQIISKLDSSWSFQRFFIVFPELLGR